MFTKEQEAYLQKFADLSDKLFDMGVITTDSFTGEIGEYIACHHYKLQKSDRVTRAIDGVCANGFKYQVKSKIISENNFTYKISNLETCEFDYLVIVFFNRLYTPIKILRIPAKKIINNEIRITTSLNNSGFEIVDQLDIKVPARQKKVIGEFAKAYNDLEQKGIIRSRRIVGDIGEFYASRRLGLELSENITEKGIDARHLKSGLTFEIKTRRVYESGRRKSEIRRLNNLVDKSADFIIVVVLDRAFKCAGMWIIPSQNIVNPKSAKLNIVNSTPGVKNLIPSQISWLTTGESFKTFNAKSTKRVPLKKSTIQIKKNASVPKKHERETSPIVIYTDDQQKQFSIGTFGWIILIALFIYILSLILY